MQLRPAVERDAPELSALALRSKAHWGYDEAFIAACRDELSVKPAAINDPHQCWRVATDGNRVLGYYGMSPIDDQEAELEALFVTPEAIGTGVGRRLVDDALETASSLGFAKIVIQGDPNAEGFYLAMGATRTGDRESGSIRGRYLPVFELDCTKPA